MPTSLRERKKQETRDRIRAAALDLFGREGFDHVTVAEVADAANVSPATVFNYFPTKEDLIFQGMAEYGESLVRTLRERPPGVSIVEAFRNQLLQPRGALTNPDPGASAAIVLVRGIIAGSAALQAREHLLAAASADELSALLAGDSEEALVHRFLATAMLGANKAAAWEIYRLATQGKSGTEIAQVVLPQAAAAVEILIRGLGSLGQGSESPTA